MENSRALFHFFLRGFLFAIPLLALYELGNGGWFSDHRLEGLLLKRNVTESHAASYCAGCPGTNVLFQTDAYGFRGRGLDYSKVDLLSVGSSTTQQWELNEHDTWQAVIKREFSRNGRPVEILNAGVSGQSLKGFSRDFDLWFPFVPGMKAKYVLVYIDTDEIASNEVEDAYSEEMDQLEGQQSGMSRIAHRSALLFLARGLWGTWKARVLQGGGHRSVDLASMRWTKTPLLEKHRALLAPRFTRFRQRLLSLIEKVRNFGAKPILVLGRDGRIQFQNGEWEGTAEEFRSEGISMNGMDMYFLSREMAADAAVVAGSSGATFIDLSRLKDMHPSDFVDYRHNSPEGAIKIGRALYSSLASLEF